MIYKGFQIAIVNQVSKSVVFELLAIIAHPATKFRGWLKSLIQLH